MALENYVTQLHTDCYGNGQPGLFDRVRKFLDGYEAIDRMRHRSNTFRLNVIIALSGLAVAILTGIGIIVTVNLAKHASLDPQHIFMPDKTGQVYTALDSPPQMAIEPTLR